MNRSRSFGVLIALGFTVSFVMLTIVGAVGYFSIVKLWNNTHELAIDLCSDRSAVGADVGHEGCGNRPTRLFAYRR